MNRTAWLKTGFYAYVGLAMAATLILVLARHDGVPTFDPLRLPEQSVNNAGPIRNGDGLLVTGIKCNTSDRTLVVRGQTYWTSVDPRGTTLLTGAGVTVREPGCVSIDYTNLMPPAVQEANRRLFASGLPYVVWKITGSETPEDDRSGYVTRTRSWHTKPFRVYPKNTDPDP